MTIHNSTAELIGNTPLIRLNHVTEGIKATIAAKVEYFNPGGSSKDRIAERIIDAAEQSGGCKHQHSTFLAFHRFSRFRGQNISVGFAGA